MMIRWKTSESIFEPAADTVRHRAFGMPMPLHVIDTLFQINYLFFIHRRTHKPTSNRAVHGKEPA